MFDLLVTDVKEVPNIHSGSTKSYKISRLQRIGHQHYVANKIEDKSKMLVTIFCRQRHNYRLSTNFRGTRN